MKKCALIWLLICVTMGTAFAKPSKADLEKAADNILESLSLFPETDLTGCSNAYSAVIDKLDKVSKLKSLADIYKSYRAMVQISNEYKRYKKAGRDGDLAYCRNKLLKQTAAFVETVASNGMGITQGGIMSLAIKSCINAVDVISARNDRIEWLDSVSLTDYYNLAAENGPYYKYAGTATLMYKNGQSLAEIKTVLENLVKIENKMADAPVSTQEYIQYGPIYSEGDRGHRGPNGGTIFYCNKYGGYAVTANRGSVDWNTALKWERDNKNDRTYDGWRLPTPDELNEIYKNKKLLNITTNESYWAKSSNGRPFAQNFGTGQTSDNPAPGNRHVVFVKGFGIYTEKSGIW